MSAGQWNLEKTGVQKMQRCHLDYSPLAHTHTHKGTCLLINALQRIWWLSDPTPPIMKNPQCAFSGTIEGNDSAPGIIQKIYRGPQQGNEMDAWPLLFYVFVGHVTVMAPRSILLLCIWRLYLLSVSLDNKTKWEVGRLARFSLIVYFLSFLYL